MSEFTELFNEFVGQEVQMTDRIIGYTFNAATQEREPVLQLMPDDQDPTLDAMTNLARANGVHLNVGVQFPGERAYKYSYAPTEIKAIVTAHIVQSHDGKYYVKGDISAVLRQKL